MMDRLLRFADFIVYLGMVLFGVFAAVTYTVISLLLVSVILVLSLLLVSVILVLMAFLCILLFFIVFVIFHWLWVAL